MTHTERRSRRTEGGRGGDPRRGVTRQSGPGRQALLRVGGFAGLCLIWVLMGGAAGAFLARDAVDEAQPGVVLSLAPLPAEEAEAEIAALEALPSEAADAASAGLDGAAVVDDEPVVLRGAREIRLAGLTVPEPNPAKLPMWQRNAVSVSGVAGRPMIAVVIDDLGLNRPGTWRAIDLPAPLTLAFMTYAEDLGPMTHAAHAAGHELLLHVPMEPRSPRFDPGPNVLNTRLGKQEAERRLKWGLGRFSGFVGINNHMGSRFTASAQGMAMVMHELKQRGLLFLDSVTTGSSVGPALARRAGVPYARRDVFLDNDPGDPRTIRRQLAALERVARMRGYAVGIGHPHPATLAELARWLPEARRRGFALVPISAIVRRRVELAQQRSGDAG